MAIGGKKIINLVCFLLCIAAPLRAEQLSSPKVLTDQTELRLFSASLATGDSHTLPLGLEIKLRPGWKTYWRSPGDAGFPLMLEAVHSTNVSGFKLHWPIPHRFELFGLQTFGYDNQVVFPIDITLKEPGQPAEILLRARYLVCEQICVPYEADLALAIPAGPAHLSDDAALLNQFRSLLPGEGSGLRFKSIAWDGEKHITAFVLSDQASLQAPDLLIEGPQGYQFGRPEVRNMGREATLKVEVFRDNIAPDIAQTALNFTLIDGKRGVEAKVDSLGALSPPQSRGFPWTILLIALLGGVILNAMPCVLPVLVLKLTAIAEMAGKERRETRQSFMATSLGIFASFLAIALFLIGLRSAGHAIGWGVQFQQPVFLAILITICLVFSANLLGWFTIPMPAFLSGAGQWDKKSRWIKPFFTGCLATLMATPCSAPFVGTAVGFALSGSNINIATIFLAMGLGLSLPYLIVAAWPGMIRILPKPGRWMVSLKKILALSLLGTAVWLGFVLAGQAGFANIASRKSGIPWRAFDRTEMSRLVGQGEVVFVDVTADWCLTCLANEQLILGQESVREKISEIIPMRGDWTKPSAAISAFLSDHQRYGIPFNIVYGPRAKDGIILPEILTPGAVLQAIESAK